MRIPLGGGQRDRSEIKVARMRKEKALLDLKTVEVAIGNALHTAMEKVAIARKSAEDNRLVGQFNQKVLEVELQRLDAGTGNSRRVLEVEEDLLDAQVAEWKSLSEYRRALVEWRLAQGSVLSERGLDVIRDGGQDEYMRLRRTDSILESVGVRLAPAVAPAPQPAEPPEEGSVPDPDAPVPTARFRATAAPAEAEVVRPAPAAGMSDAPVPRAPLRAQRAPEPAPAEQAPAVAPEPPPAGDPDAPVPSGRRSHES
jgi:hypothetical protein